MRKIKIIFPIILLLTSATIFGKLGITIHNQSKTPVYIVHSICREKNDVPGMGTWGLDLGKSKHYSTKIGLRSIIWRVDNKYYQTKHFLFPHELFIYPDGGYVMHEKSGILPKIKHRRQNAKELTRNQLTTYSLGVSLIEQKIRCAKSRKQRARKEKERQKGQKDHNGGF